MKKIYKIWQTINTGYDTYSDAIVCAESEDEAKNIHPSEYNVFIDGELYFKYSNGRVKKEDYTSRSWSELKDVQVKEIGIANDNNEIGSVICSSFHAG